MNKSYKETVSQIACEIRNCVEAGEKNFILYPFGVNGMLTKSILKEQFGIEPAYILDNQLCKTNKQIYSVDYLGQLDEVNKYIILITIERPSVYDDIVISAYKYVNKSRVLELFSENRPIPDQRTNWLKDFSELVEDSGMRGNVAECGVYRGGFARFINVFFPDKKCYLFDSFEGFRECDIDVDKKINPASPFLEKVNLDLFSVTNVDYVISKLPFPERVEIRKGYVPETFKGVEDESCFVNLDMDLYSPTFEALKFFYPRMVAGGVILLHDYFFPEIIGVKKAVQAFEDYLGVSVCKIPMRTTLCLAIVKN